MQPAMTELEMQILGVELNRSVCTDSYTLFAQGYQGGTTSLEKCPGPSLRSA